MTLHRTQGWLCEKDGILFKADMFVLRQRLIHFSDGTKAKDFTIQSLVVTVSTTIFNYQNPYFISARYFSFMSVAISTAINHLYMTYSFVYRRFHKIEKNDY